MRIFMIASEASPFYKTGGLADVVYSLSKQYVSLGEKVSVVLPYYKNAGNHKLIKGKKIDSFVIKMNWRNIDTNIYEMESENITYYFVECDNYFARESLYGSYDDGERFAFFNNAVCEFLAKQKEKIDVIHVHDWHTAMIPCLLEIKYKQHENLGKVKTILTIHNPMFKGFFHPNDLYDFYELPMEIYKNGSIRLNHKVSTLKAGIFYSDKITTVSPTHSDELTTELGGFGLSYDLTLRRGDFVGILNGINTEDFNPADDPNIYKNFDLKSFEKAKKANKEALIKEFGHGESIDKPLFGCVTRLSDQKGLDLINSMAGYIVRSDAIIAVLGNGDPGEEEYLNKLSVDYPYNSIIYIGYSDSLARKIYAASDFFLMPSRFEPCGLAQMMAQRYGSLPIVRLTGGLKDTVTPYFDEENNEKVANGFGFKDDNGFAACVCTKFALKCFEDKKLMNTLITNAMKLDNSWKVSAEKYLELYKSIKK